MPTLQVSSVPTDPNFLAMVFHGINDPAKSDKRNAYDPPEDDTLPRRQARVLDSIAYVLVSQPRKEVIAVGIVVTNPSRAGSNLGSGPEPSPPAIEILIANNGMVEDDTCQYLKNVLQSLREIREANPGIKGSPRLPLAAILKESAKLHEQLLVDLELSILERVWPKLQHRFKKSHRDTTFLEVVNYIQGDDTITLINIPEDMRRALHYLQTFKEHLTAANVDMGKRIYYLTKLLASKTPTVEYLDLTRRILHEVHRWTLTLARHPEFVRNWNEFSVFVIQKNTKSDPLKDPDVLHWLSKVAAPCAHFLRIADIPASRKISDWLLGDIQVVAVCDPSVWNKSKAVIDASGVKTILNAAQLEEKDYSDRKITRFLEGLSAALNTPLSNGKLDIVRSIPVHCECTILNHIHGRTAVPYIGVSKLSCACCFNYFTAYNSCMHTSIQTRGTHLQSSIWRYPTKLKHARLQKTFCAILRDEIAVGWKSTEPSADERLDNVLGDSEGVLSLSTSLDQLFP